MALTALQLLQQFAGKTNLPQPSAGLASSTDPATIQLKYLLYEVGRDLRSRKCWPQLKRTHNFTTTNADYQYQLPADFYCSLLDVAWDTTNRWKLNGAVTDARWNDLTYGYAPIAVWSSFRIFGLPGTGQFEINPTPGSSAIDITFDYVSSYWIVSNGTWGESILSDDDLFAFDDDCLLNGLSVNWPDNKGLNYDRYKQDYERSIQNAAARWQGARKTSLSPNRWGIWPNIPQGDWTL